MPNTVSTKALAAALVRMGFAELRSGGAGSHRIFEHRGSGLKVTVPHRGEPIRPVHLSAIRRQVSNFEIASDEEFDRLVASTRDPQSWQRL
jgi:predicted RNA binding protein YcfA (HicA-like mRNA interferase family)